MWPAPRAYRLPRWALAAPGVGRCRAEREEIKRLRAEFKRVEQKRDILKKVVTIFAQPPAS